LPGVALSTFTDTSASRNIDLTAPGESIVSLRDPKSNIDTSFSAAEVGTNQFRGSGTSQAAAVVSGAVALLLQKRPTLTPDQVKALLKGTATPVAGGVGEINLAAALPKATPSGSQTWWPSSGSGSIEWVRGSNHVLHGL